MKKDLPKHALARERAPAPWLVVLLGVLATGAIGALGGPADPERLAPLLVCSHGPRDQRFNVGVTVPARALADSTYEVRIDGVSSGKISHVGLNYLHDMTVDYILPGGAYVEGSARVVPGTGSANVLPGAYLSHHAGILTMTLPGKVDEGTNYTPPSLTLQLRANGAPGTSAVVAFNHFTLRANAVVIGDVVVACDPAVKPSILGTTLITAPERSKAL